MKNTSKKFRLFGMEPFSNLTGEKHHAIANSIVLTSDANILAQAERLEEYCSEIAKRNTLAHVNIAFDRDQVNVEPFVGTAQIMNYMRTSWNPVKRGFVKYSFPITSGASLLGYQVTHKNSYREVEITNNKLVFEYQSSYASIDFPENVKKEISRDASTLKVEILDECTALNKEVDTFHNQLPAFILPLLQQRLAKAQKAQKNIADLNPF